MQLSRYEQETIIVYNEEDKTANVYTHSAAMHRRLDKLAQVQPDECKTGRVSHDGQAAEYTVPKSWVKIKPPRIASEKQKEALQKARLSLKSSAHAEITEDESA